MSPRIISIFLVILLITSYSPIGMYNTVKAEASTEQWHIVVLPYFNQTGLYNYSEEKAVFVYAYNSMDIVVDLNHNGQRDENEPEIKITKPGMWFYITIGSKIMGLDPYVETSSDIGPLWILTKGPILASMLVAYQHRYVGAYNMPPPGEEFIVPDIPGYLYISTAVPEKAHVKVYYNTNNTLKGEYTVNPGDTLIVYNGGEPLRITSDKPIAVALTGKPAVLKDIYMTEIIPQEEEFEVNWRTMLPIPSQVYDAINVGLESFESLDAIVLNNGSIIWVNNTLGGRIGDVINSHDSSIVYMYVITDYGGIAITPLYSPHGWYSYFNRSLYFLTSYRPQFGTTLSSIEIVPVSGDGRSFIRIASRHDITKTRYEFILANVYNLGYELALYPSQGDLIRALLGYAQPVLVYTYSSLKYMMLRTGGIPVDKNLIEDDYLGGSPINYVIPSNELQGFINITGTRMINTAGRYEPVHIKFHSEVQPPGSCNIDWIYALLDAKFEAIAYKYFTDTCEVNFAAEIKPLFNTTFYHLLIPLGKDGTLYAPYILQIFLAPNRATPTRILNNTTKLKIIPEETGVYTPKGPFNYKLHPGRIVARKILGPVNSIHDYLLSLGIIIGQPGGPSTTTTTTMATTTSHKTTRTTTTSKTTPSKTTTSGGETIANLPIPLKDGDKLVYTIKISAKGSEGSMTAGAKVEYTVQLSNGTVYLKPGVVTLPKDQKALVALGAKISDLLISIASGEDLEYKVPSLDPTMTSKCPALNPDADSKTISGKTFILFYDVKYSCKYSNGVLTSLKAKIHGELAGQSLDVNIGVNLKETTIEGVKIGGGGSSIVLYGAIGGAIIVVVIVLVLLLARRRS